MTDYVLEGPKWGGSSLGRAGGTITWAADSSVPAGFASLLATAFSDWSSWANIQFRQVAATIAPQIDLSFGPIDGPDNILGETTYDTHGTAFLSADIAFDTGEQWTVSGNQAASADGVNFFVVALHEIGHALGLDHYNAAPAVMNATIDLALTDLTQSDIDGIQALYGPSATPFATTVHDTASAGGQVYALYDAILGRTPDTLGFETYVAALQAGTSLHDVAAAMLSSTEAQGHLGASDNATFVNQLYLTALNRPADPSGLRTYTDFLNGGGSRADLAITLALSQENQAGLQGALTTGVSVPDPNASGVARLYYGVLDRPPDLLGLSHYTALVDQGSSFGDVAGSMLASQEYQGAHAGLNSAQYVDALYQGALGRHADSGGLATYTGLLAAGTSRATIAIDIAESQEAKTTLLPLIEQGHHLA